MRTKTGTITSAKMTGTVTVTVHRSVFHPLYQKRYRVSKKFLADSNGMDLGMGDMVIISECRPISKRKCFRVTEVVKRAPRVSEMGEESGLGDVMNKKSQKATDGADVTDVKKAKRTPVTSDSSQQP